MKRYFLNLFVWFVITLAIYAFAQSAPVRLSGSVTLAKLITEKQSELEAKSGVKIESVGNSTGRGFEDFSAGRSSVVLLAGPLAPSLKVFNEKSPTKLDSSNLKVVDVKSVPAVLIVHPENKVSNLTTEQLSGILSGKITHWKDVGGADLPVKLVLPPPGDGLALAIQQDVMGGGDFGRESIKVQLSPDAIKVVSQMPNAVGFVSLKNKTENVKDIKLDKPLSFNLSLVTKSDAPSDVKKVVETIQQTLSGK